MKKRTAVKGVKETTDAIVALKVKKSRASTARRTKKNIDKSITLKLATPIEIGDDVVLEHLTIKPPKAKHVRSMRLDEISMNEMLNLAGKLSGQPPSVIDELVMEDTYAVITAVSDFL